MSDDNGIPPSEVIIQDLYSQLNRRCKKAGNARLRISEKKIIELIFARAQEFGVPLSAEAFQLLPYIKNGDIDYDERVFNVLKMLFHSSDFNAQNEAVSAISDNFYVWSRYFSFKRFKDLVDDHLQMRNIFRYMHFDSFFNSMEIYEAVIRDLDFDYSMVHDTYRFSNKEIHIIGEYKHLLKVHKTVVTSLLQVFSYLAVDKDKSKQVYEEIVSYISDLDYLDVFTRKDDPVHLAEEAFLMSGTRDYRVTDQNTASHILDLADLSAREGNFDRNAFFLLPYITVNDLHSFRIQQILKSALSPDSKIRQKAFETMIMDFEIWLTFVTTEHVNYMINMPLLVNADQDSLKNIRLDLKQLIKVMNILENVAERKFFHPIYLENLLFGTLIKLVKNGRRFYIRRMAIVVSLRLHANLFRNHPDLYDGYHPYFYDNVLQTLGCMNRLWNGNSYLCEKMLQVIRENESLFGIYPSDFELEKKQSTNDVERMVEKIRVDWINSVRLSVI